MLYCQDGLKTMGLLGKFVEERIDRKNEADYDRCLAEATPSFDDWIRAKEAGFPVFDMTIAESESGSGEQGLNEYTAKLGSHSYRIIPMAKCSRGFSLKTYFEDIIVFCNGELTEIALSQIGACFDASKDILVVYGDEDISSRDESDKAYEGVYYGTRSNPYFKPEWSPGEFISHFYFCNIAAVRRSAFRDLDWSGESTGAAFIYHNLSKVIFANEFNARSSVVRAEGTLIHAADYSNNLITDRFVRESAMRLSKSMDSKYDISAVILTENNLQRLEKTLESLSSSAAFGELKVEYIVVDNMSSESIRRKTVELQLKYSFRYEYMTERKSRQELKNHALRVAEGRVVFLTSDRVTFPEPELLSEMYDLTLFRLSGAVGAKLVRTGAEEIVHAGIVFTALGPMYKLRGLSDSEDHGEGYNRHDRNVLALSFECAMLRRDLFDKIGGFDTELTSEYSDADFCLRLYEAGYYNAVCNSKRADYDIFDEEMPVGALLSPEVSFADRLKFYAEHPYIKVRDPFYNMRLLRDNSDPRILPACEFSFEDSVESAERIYVSDFAGMSRCTELEMTVEFAGSLDNFTFSDDGNALYMQGYMLITGENNARYLKYILLRSDKIEYYIPVRGCYRSDCLLKYPNEKGILLSGFAVKIEKKLLPLGTYQVGAMMQKKHFREKAVNYTDSYLVNK